MAETKDLMKKIRRFGGLSTPAGYRPDLLRCGSITSIPAPFRFETSPNGAIMEKVILVDEQDHVIGTMEKMEAHKKGLLHRAFSILIFSSKGEFLLQKRSIKK